MVLVVLQWVDKCKLSSELLHDSELVKPCTVANNNVYNVSIVIVIV